MAWTYDPAQLATSALYRVRFYCGDTDTNDQQVQDEEILFLLTQTTDEKLAAAMVCEHLARFYSREVSKRIGSLSVSADARARAYAARAAELRTESGILADVFVGGISISDKASLDSDSDAVQPSFRLGMDDNPRAPSERRTDDTTED